MNQQSETPSKATGPYVSVIIPAYNVAGYLERTLDSALTQTISVFEVIVVDDASSDTTFEVASSVAARDARVRVLRNESNRGPAASRNRAMHAARGEWIALLDGDDAWRPERLERMMAYATNADVISDDVYVVARSRTKPGEYMFWSLLRERGLTLTKPRWLSLRDFVGYDIGLIHPIFRRTFLTSHRLAYNPSPSLRGIEDFHFYFEILWKGARWLQLPRAYYLWTSGRVGSLTSNQRVHWQRAIEATRSLCSHPAAAEDAALAATLERRIQECSDILVYDTIRDLLRHRRFAEFAKFLLEQPSSLSLMVKRSIKRLHVQLVLSRRLAEMEKL
jgi:succinoglycan biosynthesis protein ExoO